MQNKIVFNQGKFYSVSKRPHSPHFSIKNVQFPPNKVRQTNAVLKCARKTNIAPQACQLTRDEGEWQGNDCQSLCAEVN